MVKKPWSPGQGPDADPATVPGVPGHLGGDGDDRRSLWAPSEGPARPEPGGPGGEPDGATIPRRDKSPLDE